MDPLFVRVEVEVLILSYKISLLFLEVKKDWSRVARSGKLKPFHSV